MIGRTWLTYGRWLGVGLMGALLGIAIVGWHSAHAGHSAQRLARAHKCVYEFTYSAGSTTLSACFIQEIKDALVTDGLPAAFSLFTLFYKDEPKFQGSICHLAGHELGAAAFDLYATGKVFNAPETSYCGYGFFHGYMERMLTVAGPGSYDAARSYCASLTSEGPPSDLELACDHGIGHALFDMLPSSLYGSADAMTQSGIASCEKTLSVSATFNQKERCATGIFNALSLSLPEKRYGVGYDGMHTFDVCARAEQQYKPACYSEMVPGYIYDMHIGRDEALRIILSVPNAASVDRTVRRYVNSEVNFQLVHGKPPTSLSLCATISKNVEKSCISGALGGIFVGASQPGQEYITAFEFCAAGTRPESRAACYQEAADRSGKLAHDHNAFLAACRALPPEFALRCE